MMDCNKILICTPIYKRRLNDFEFKNLKISEYTNPNIKKIFFAPYKLNLDFYIRNFKAHKIIKFDNCYFKSTDSYSKLLLSEKFYKKFIRYTHIIIHQPDSIIVKNFKNLSIKNFDYIGAPSKYRLPKFNTFFENKNFLYENKKLNFFNKCVSKFKRKINYDVKLLDKNLNFLNIYNHLKKYLRFFLINKTYHNIGLNGGLSIRNVRKFILILNGIPNIKQIKAPEDHIFSYFSNIGKLRIPTYKNLMKIFSEKKKMNVYGYHQLDVYDNDYLREIHKNFYFINCSIN
jgi:hypothetical protein